MRTRNIFRSLKMSVLLYFIFSTVSLAQSVTVYQYRKVPADKVEEFIKRETTYAAEVAKKAIAKGNMTFWCFLEKVGGYDLENSSNYLFINTYKNLDDLAGVWNFTAAFPNVPAAKMETGSLSTTTSMFFLHDEGWEQSSKANPEKDFNYVHLIYINSSDPAAFIAGEKKSWAPFIKASMENNLTKQMGWGNAMVLNPLGDNIKFNSISYDLYKTLHDAVVQKWDEKTVFPQAELTELAKLELNRRGDSIYRIIKVVTAPPPPAK